MISPPKGVRVYARRCFWATESIGVYFSAGAFAESGFDGNFLVPRAEGMNKQMKTRSVQIQKGGSRKQHEIVRRSLQPVGMLVFVVGGCFVAIGALAASRQPAAPQASHSTSIPHVKCVIGLENIKPNTKGTLSVLPSGLEFATGKNKLDVN
jgi:hypothetical protein